MLQHEPVHWLTARFGYLNETIKQNVLNSVLKMYECETFPETVTVTKPGLLTVYYLHGYVVKKTDIPNHHHIPPALQLHMHIKLSLNHSEVIPVSCELHIERIGTDVQLCQLQMLTRL